MFKSFGFIEYSWNNLTRELHQRQVNEREENFIVMRGVRVRPISRMRFTLISIDLRSVSSASYIISPNLHEWIKYKVCFFYFIIFSFWLRELTLRRFSWKIFRNLRWTDEQDLLRHQRSFFILLYISHFYRPILLLSNLNVLSLSSSLSSVIKETHLTMWIIIIIRRSQRHIWYEEMEENA